MLVLTDKDINRIDRILIQNAVAKAYEIMDEEQYNMPDRIHVADKDNVLLLMPCFAGPYFATKLVSVFPGAPDLGQPVVNGVLTLSDNHSGAPLAFMDGAAVTRERTGAVGGLAISKLTDPGIESCGIFGAGVQGLSQVRYLLLNRKVKTVRIFSAGGVSARNMAQTLSKEFADTRFEAVDDADRLVKDSDLVIAATTSSTPLFSDNPALVKGKVFVSIGSFTPDMQEFPDAVIRMADRIYVDTPFAAKESGDICKPLAKNIVSPDRIRPFSQIVGSKRTGSELSAPEVAGSKGYCAGETCFFKSVGMALFDLTVASELFEQARSTKSGVNVDF